MRKISTIELFKENMKFSVGHFTLFSETLRENLHGHNYTVYLAITAEILEQGLSFDYRFYKEKIRNLCLQLNQSVLIPTKSAYLKIEDQGDYYCLYFHTEKLFFLKRDVTLLPLTNITVEELSHWFILQLIQERDELERHLVHALTVKVANAPGQVGSSHWEKQA